MNVKDDEYENITLNLLFNNHEVRDVITPYLDTSIFHNFENKQIVKSYIKFLDDHSKNPKEKDMFLEISDSDVAKKLESILEIDISQYTEESLFNNTERWYKEQLILEANTEIAEALESKDHSRIELAPESLRQALAFQFKVESGTFLLGNHEKLYEDIFTNDNPLPSGIQALDDLIEGGFPEKALTLFLAPTNKGKSLIKCSLATSQLLNDKNVVYFTCEMSEKKTAHRFVSNLVSKPINLIKNLTPQVFGNLMDKVTGRLGANVNIKEYSPKELTAGKIENYLRELEVKHDFKADIIFVDYLGLMTSTSKRASDSTYIEMKCATEELRALAVKTGIPIVSSVQTNRTGSDKEVQADLTSIGESWAIAQTADIVIGVHQPPELYNDGENSKYFMTLLKNRYGRAGTSFYTSVIYEYMRIFDVAPNDPLMLEIEENKKKNAEMGFNDSPSKAFVR